MRYKPQATSRKPQAKSLQPAACSLKHKAGFTLVEVLASVGILVTFLTAALVSFTATQNLSEGTQQQASVLQATKAKLEEMRASNFRDLLTNYGDGGTGMGQAFTIVAGEMVGNIVLTDVYDDDPAVEQLWLGAHDDYPVGTGDNWIQGGNINTSVQPASVVFNNKIWVLGGFGSSGDINDVWYSEDGQTWTSVTTTAPMWSARRGHSSVTLDGKIWVLGGRRSSDYLNDVWWTDDFNLADDQTWTEELANNLTPGPNQWSQRYWHTSVVLDGKIWVLGGFGSSGVLNDVWYSEDGQTWTRVTTTAPMWSARYGHTSVVFNNKIWVLGGFGSSGVLNDVWYSEDGQTWTSVTTTAPMWSARAGHSSVTLDGKIWVLGGFGSSGDINDVWYSEDGQTWTRVTNSPWSTGGSNWHASVVYGSKLWVLGGGAGAIYYDKTWWSYGADRMYQADITVSWRQRNGRVVGEDNGGTNGPTSAEALNGILDTGVGEDANGNGVLDSPVHITGLLANRGYPSQIYLGRE